MTKLDYVLTGCANGHPVRITGRGTVAHGRLQLAFTAAEPALAFDATFAHLAGIDAVAALVNGLVVGDDDPVVARCRADVLTDGGAEVGSIVAHVAVHRRRGDYRCVVQLAEARLAVEPDERLVSIAEREMRAVPTPLGGVALFSTGAITSSRGHEWTVLATAMLLGCDAGESATLALAAIRPGQRRRNR